MPWNTQESCNIQLNTTMHQTTQSFGNSIGFCITFMRIYSKRTLEETSTTTNPCKLMRGGIYRNVSYKISQALSHLRNKYLHQLVQEIADKKSLQLSIQHECSLILSEDFWPLEVIESVERFVINDEWRVFAALSSCSFSALSPVTVSAAVVAE